MRKSSFRGIQSYQPRQRVDRMIQSTSLSDLRDGSGPMGPKTELRLV